MARCCTDFSRTDLIRRAGRIGRHGAERVVEDLAPFWAILLDASTEDAAAAVREMVSEALDSRRVAERVVSVR